MVVSLRNCSFYYTIKINFVQSKFVGKKRKLSYNLISGIAVHGMVRRLWEVVKQSYLKARTLR